MSSKKRFRTATEVEALIDRFVLEKIRLLTESGQYDQLADALRNTIESNRIRGLRDKAEHSRSQVSWRDTRIHNLKEALATIRTTELPTMETDGSIPTS